MSVSVAMEFATVAHAEELAPLLRDEDAAEGEALGLAPLEALRTSVENSDEAYAIKFNGEVALLFGVSALEGETFLSPSAGRAVIWMLSGRAVQRHPREFLKVSKAVVPALLERYEVLVNAIDARYAGALRWARWMGFDVRPAVPFGPFGMPFHPFLIRRQ